MYILTQRYKLQFVTLLLIKKQLETQITYALKIANLLLYQ